LGLGLRLKIFSPALSPGFRVRAKKMWILGPRRAVQCSRWDSLNRLALRLRTGGAHLVRGGGGGEQAIAGVIAGEQAALIADAQGAIGELMDGHRAAYEMRALAGGGQLRDEVIEEDRVVVAHDALMPAGEHQVQFDAIQFDKRALRLRGLNREAAIGDEVLLQVAVGLGIVGDSIEPQFLRQPALDGAKGALAAAAGLRRAGQDLADTERTKCLADLAILLGVRSRSGIPGGAEMAAPVGVQLAWRPMGTVSSG